MKGAGKNLWRVILCKVVAPVEVYSFGGISETTRSSV